MQPSIIAGGGACGECQGRGKQTITDHDVLRMRPKRTIMVSNDMYNHYYQDECNRAPATTHDRNCRMRVFTLDMQRVLTIMTARCRDCELGSIAPTHLEKIPAHIKTARSQPPDDMTGPDQATVGHPCARLQFHAVEFPWTAAVPRVETCKHSVWRASVAASQHFSVLQGMRLSRVGHDCVCGVNSEAVAVNSLPDWPGHKLSLTRQSRVLLVHFNTSDVTVSLNSRTRYGFLPRPRRS